MAVGHNGRCSLKPFTVKRFNFYYTVLPSLNEANTDLRDIQYRHSFASETTNIPRSLYHMIYIRDMVFKASLTLPAHMQTACCH